MVPIGDGIKVMAYHAPKFQSHILSVGALLDDDLEVSFNAQSGVPKAYIYRRGTDVAIHEAKKIRGLLSVRMPENKLKVLEVSGPSSANDRKCAEWHARLGHPSIDRFMQMITVDSSVPKFTRAQVSRVHCVPCMTAKTGRAPISDLTYEATRPLEHLSVDISRPVSASWAGSTCTAAILDAYSRYSDLAFV